MGTCFAQWGGGVLITVPLMWPEHMLPYDFYRYTSLGLALMLKEAGFEIIEHRKITVGIRAIFQLFLEWLSQGVLSPLPHKILRILTPFLFTPITFLAVLLSLLPCSEEKTYIDNVILARKL